MKIRGGCGLEVGYWDLKEDIEVALGEREMQMLNTVGNRQSKETRREVRTQDCAAR